jgi:predicted DsbA family dithiol-disulfide isomerase
MFVNRLGTRPLDQGNSAREIEKLVGQALPLYIDGAKLAEMRACHLDRDGPALPPGKMPGAHVPFLGTARGPEVVVFYDPNCPHCKRHHEGFMLLAKKYGERARFAIRMRGLWEESLSAAEALKLAENTARYYELWEAMFAHQLGPKKAFSVELLAEIFREVGLNADDLANRLAAQRATVLAERDQAWAAGIDRAPMVFIDGRKVWSGNLSADCIGTLVDRSVARAAAAGPPR